MISFLIHYMSIFIEKSKTDIYIEMAHGLILPERILSFVQLAIC